MKSKVIATLAVLMLCFAGVGFIDAGETDADDTKYLTIAYGGIIDPEDAVKMGFLVSNEGEWAITPASINYTAELVNEPVTYKDGLKFDLIKGFLNIDTFVVPMVTAAGWTANEKASILDAFAEFAGPISTEIKFTSDKDKTIAIVNAADVVTDVEVAIQAIVDEYELTIAGLNATIADKDKTIASLEEQLAQAGTSGDAQTWQIVSLVLGALFVLMAIFGGRAIVLIRKSGGKLF